MFEVQDGARAWLGDHARSALKQDMAEVLWKPIAALQDKVRADTIKAEFYQVFGEVSAGDLQGVFAVGGRVEDVKIFDVKFKPPLTACRRSWKCYAET